MGARRHGAGRAEVWTDGTDRAGWINRIGPRNRPRFSSPWIPNRMARVSWIIAASPSPPAAAGFETDLEVHVAGERLILIHERAVYWPERQCLVVSDLHWGHTAAFRAASFATPRDSARADIRRLSRAVERTACRRLVLLGDLIHSGRGRNKRAFEAFSGWRRDHPKIEIFLIQGASQPAGPIPEEWRVHRAVGPWFWKPLAFRHLPAPTPGYYTLAGHLHPVANEDRRLPCFLFGQEVAVLPAFGSFPGSMLVEPAPTDRLFLVEDGEVSWPAGP